MSIQGYSALLIGWIMSAYFVGMVLGSFFCQRLIQWVGHIRAFAAFAAIATTTVLLHGLYDPSWFWGLLRLLTGITNIGLYMVIESWLNECAESHIRGRVFSIYMLILYFGMAIGQLLLNITPAEGPEPFFVIGVLFSACLVPVAVTRSISPKIPQATGCNLFLLLKKAPLGMLGCLSAGLINGAFYSLGPVFANLIGLTLSQTAGFMAVTIFGGLLFQWPVGSISDRLHRPVVLLILSLLGAFGAVSIMILRSISFVLFLFMMGIFGGLISTLYPVSVARTHDLFETREIIPVSSALLLSYGVGASIGPVLASGMMVGLKSPDGLFAFFSLIGALFAVTGFYLVKRERIKFLPVSEQVDFAPMKNSSPVAAQLDPRGLPEDPGKAS